MQSLAFPLAALLIASSPVAGADPIRLTSPAPHQVVQRVGIAPGEGHAEVGVSGQLPPGSENCNVSYRIVPVAAGGNAEAAWQPAEILRDGQEFVTSVHVAAGGWYRLELRGQTDGVTVCEGAIEPFGVGEVFVIAGQSYATNTNEERHNVQDRHRRVVAYDAEAKSWRVAWDPQPTPDHSDGGSIWPPLGDALVAQYQVPIAFANLAWGGTSSKQWLPEGQLSQRLVETGRLLGRFRAVLWQQGESDVIEKTPTDKYVQNLVTIRTNAVRTWDFEPCWLLAKSTHHPTVYNDSEGENRIRAAIEELTKQPGFCVGPDTDTLQGENRGGPQSRRHFSAVGQTRAAAMWLDAIQATVLRPESESAK